MRGIIARHLIPLAEDWVAFIEAAYNSAARLTSGGKMPVQLFHSRLRAFALNWPPHANMTIRDIPHYRLFSQHIVASRCRTPAQVVAGLGAIQAQDYYGALWAIGL